MKGLTVVMYDANAIKTPNKQIIYKNWYQNKQYMNMRASIAIHIFHMESVLWGHGSAKAQ